MAYPFLKFIDKIFWKGKPPPTISDGVFGVLWTLHHVIDANAMMGVGGPPQVAVLEKDEKDKWNARTLLDEELQEHQQSIVAAEQSLRDYKKNLKPPPVDLNS